MPQPDHAPPSERRPTAVRRPDPLPGTLDPGRVRSGKRRERYGLFQRRARPAVFGEPQFECELVATAVHPQRPHVIAYDAWRRLFGAARRDGLSGDALERLQIHSAYRSVALQRQIFEYRLEERREARRAAGKPTLAEADLKRIQRKWTAEPGTSAHHSGFALDLGLYHLGRRESKRHEAYVWLAENAIRFGFYPYLPEGWHWEYNPPGLVRQLAELRRRLAAGEPVGELLRAPEPIPRARPRLASPSEPGTTG